MVTLAFGAEVWRAFLTSTEFTRTVVLEQGGTGWFKIQSVFAWVRMWGGGIALAYALQVGDDLGRSGTGVAVAQPRLIPASNGGTGNRLRAGHAL